MFQINVANNRRQVFDIIVTTCIPSLLQYRFVATSVVDNKAVGETNIVFKRKNVPHVKNEFSFRSAPVTTSIHKYIYIYIHITMSGKFVQLTPGRILQTFGLHHSIEGAFLLACNYQFSFDRLFSFIRKI